MPSIGPLTREDHALILLIRQNRAAWRGLTSPYDGYCPQKHRRRAHRLVREGYLRVEQHSEHVRGERRIYWWVFYLTERGQAAVA